MGYRDGQRSLLPGSASREEGDMRLFFGVAVGCAIAAGLLGGPRSFAQASAARPSIQMLLSSVPQPASSDFTCTRAPQPNFVTAVIVSGKPLEQSLYASENRNLVDTADRKLNVPVFSTFMIPMQNRMLVMVLAVCESRNPIPVGNFKSAGGYSGHSQTKVDIKQKWDAVLIYNGIDRINILSLSEKNGNPSIAISKANLPSGDRAIDVEAWKLLRSYSRVR
jgi:hypothetical protein